MVEDKDSGNEAADSARQPATVSEDVLNKARDFETRLRVCEAEKGVNHADLAEILDDYADFLRANNYRVLDAANFAARARVIRGEKQSSAPLLENLSFAEREKTDHGGKAVLAICGGLILLFIASLALLFADYSARTHAKEIEVDKRARAQQPQLGSDSEPSGAAALSTGNYGGREAVIVNDDDLGGVVSIDKFFVRGKKTVVYFHSNQCSYCNSMMPLVQQLARRRPDLQVCIIYIDRPDADGIDFESPVAEQFDIHSVPKFRLYDERGSFLAGDDEAKQQVKSWMRESGVAR